MNELPLEEIVVEEEEVLEEISAPVVESDNEYVAKLDTMYAMVAQIAKKYEGYVSKGLEIQEQTRKENKKEIKKLNKQIKKTRKENAKQSKLFKHTYNDEKIRDLDHNVTKLERKVQALHDEPGKKKIQSIVSNIDRDLIDTKGWDKNKVSSAVTFDMKSKSIVYQHRFSVGHVLSLYKEKVFSELGDISPKHKLLYEKAFKYIVRSYNRKEKYINKRTSRIATIAGFSWIGGLLVTPFVASSLFPVAVAVGLAWPASGVGTLYGTREISHALCRRVNRKADTLFAQEWDIYKKDFANQLEQVK